MVIPDPVISCGYDWDKDDDLHGVILVGGDIVWQSKETFDYTDIAEEAAISHLAATMRKLLNDTN